MISPWKSDGWIIALTLEERRDYQRRAVELEREKTLIRTILDRYQVLKAKERRERKKNES